VLGQGDRRGFVRKKVDSRIRGRVSLNGLWDAKPDDSEELIKDWIGSFKIHVPGYWNDIPEFHEYEGPMWYKRRVNVPIGWSQGKIHLYCEGASYESVLWIDGRKILTHNGLGFFSFWTDPLTLDAGEEHKIVFRIDSRGKEGRIGLDFGWQNYSGILGDTFLERTEDVYFDDVSIFTGLNEIGATIKVQYSIANSNRTEREVGVLLQVSDGGNAPVLSKGIPSSLTPGENVFSETFPVENPRLWSCDSPSLYKLDAWVKSRTGEALDHISTKFGIRTVTWTDKDFLLNGKRTVIKGLQVMHTYPEFGISVPTKLLLDDIKLIKGCNANLVRAHYPLSEDFLSLADSFGIMVIESIPFTGYYVEKEYLAMPETIEAGKVQLEQMIRCHENHPSIVAWSVWNEFESGRPEAVPVTKTLVGKAKELDRSRAVVFATLSSLNEGAGQTVRGEACVPFGDIACLNIFCGWYDRRISELGPEVERIHSKFPDKPILITEFAFFTICGFHAVNTERWSEEYQEKSLQEYIRVLQEKEYVIGAVYATFSDWKIYLPARLLANEAIPMQINHAGIVDSYRRPKKAYFTLKEIFARWR
jgi:beta-glucuronidase